MGCPNCGFETENESAIFCQECGTYLINNCSSDHCDLNDGEKISLPDNAKFCPYCGSESTFKKQGLFDK
ncbi:TPA: zinc-ribbon domain-containing protein [Clostridium botulinum]|nr:zinc-ribbon domain-containing protein [Clostridium botulinum]